MTLSKILIANRGEIAVRIAQAARARGITTVLAASAADRDSRAAGEVDQVLTIGPAPARDSYLNADLIVHAAKMTGCEAIHPGYGFLSERASFAQLCEDEGIVFIGPTAEQIRLVGDKLGARNLAATAGVPMAAGSDEVATLDEALATAAAIGYPVITKASAGGGGRGMFVAADEDALRSGFDRASLEAAEAFGDGRMYIETFVQGARHVEVQVVGDGRGQVFHFGERDCSIQRRYQKMVEESPAVILGGATRSRLHQAAVNLLTPINYRSAGTVEFLYDTVRDDFYFMEVNARLQVEHPVSEQVCGVDLVGLQLDVANGSLNLDQSRIGTTGHAIEVRILAENPHRGFLPSPGTITGLHVPVRDGVRLDSAVVAGSTVPPYYDSMIAKLIVTADDRGQATALLASVLTETRIEGISTNIDLLRTLVADPDYLSNNTSTRWLDTHVDRLVAEKEVA